MSWATSRGSIFVSSSKELKALHRGAVYHRLGSRVFHPQRNWKPTYATPSSGDIFTSFILKGIESWRLRRCKHADRIVVDESVSSSKELKENYGSTSQLSVHVLVSSSKELKAGRYVCFSFGLWKFHPQRNWKPHPPSRLFPWRYFRVSSSKELKVVLLCVVGRPAVCFILKGIESLSQFVFLQRYTRFHPQRNWKLIFVKRFLLRASKCFILKGIESRIHL